MVQAGITHGTSVEWSGQLLARGNNIIVPIPVPRQKFGGCSEEEKKRLESDTQELLVLIKTALQLVVCVFSE